MIVKDVEFTLKDGRKAVLRCPKEEDIQGMVDYVRISAQETDFLVRCAEDGSNFTWENEKVWAEGKNAGPDSLVLVCVVDGKVAGNCDISRMTSLKVRHRASVGIALLREFWGQGIGTKMFEEMLRAAVEEWEGVTQAELEFIEGNARARALYEKMGFRITGVHPDAIRQPDGRLVNVYTMIKKL